VFSLIKQKNIELIIQKCTEIGVSGFIPLKTERSSSENINIPRLNGIAIEASEQCGRLDIPEISSPITINELEKMQGQGWVFLLLNQNGIAFSEMVPNNAEVYIISGPEGGFTEYEINQLGSFSNKVKISQNILRAETAAILGCGLYFL
jgi:16S rRNA (uracil1498-N3)-methyltransferase